MMLIEKLENAKNSLSRKTVLLTGAGGGIGFEAARALLYMGAAVIIAEVDKAKGEAAAATLAEQFPTGKVEFYAVDLSEETQIYALHEYLIKRYGFIDVLFHNACMTPMGNVEEVPIATWDKSYRVNFKAPLLLTQLFLPEMKRQNKGTIVFVPSSGAAPYMGAYEVFKTAQVELCNTLSAELEGSEIYTYSIGPGLVKTETAMNSIEIVAAKMGLSTTQFYAMNDKHILKVEDAGVGFALSVLYAKRYSGQEIGSIAPLIDSGLYADVPSTADTEMNKELLSLLKSVTTVYHEQYLGWQQRSIFERQWVLRDFKKFVGISAEQFENDMNVLIADLTTENKINLASYKARFEKLSGYYTHQHKLLQSFEKNPQSLAENSNVILGWIANLQAVLATV